MQSPFTLDSQRNSLRDEEILGRVLAKQKVGGVRGSGSPPEKLYFFCVFGGVLTSMKFPFIQRARGINCNAAIPSSSPRRLHFVRTIASLLPRMANDAITRFKTDQIHGTLIYRHMITPPKTDFLGGGVESPPPETPPMASGNELSGGDRLEIIVFHWENELFQSFLKN